MTIETETETSEGLPLIVQVSTRGFSVSRLFDNTSWPKNNDGPDQPTQIVVICEKQTTV